MTSPSDVSYNIVTVTCVMSHCPPFILQLKLKCKSEK